MTKTAGAIEVEGTVVECLPNATFRPAFRVIRLV
jgi:translation initiation factor IF-1